MLKDDDVDGTETGARNWDTLENREEEGQMPNLLSCSKCRKEGRESTAQITLRPLGGHDMVLRGVLECEHDGHRWPIAVRADQLLAVGTALPVAESAKLHRHVPKGIQQDVREAEDAHFAGTYKASVVMCRRALQLALEERLGIPEEQRLTLGPLLKKQKARQPPLLDDRTEQLAYRIKDEGDGGAHSPVSVDPKDAEVVIHDTVVVLNELFPKTERTPS